RRPHLGGERAGRGEPLLLHPPQRGRGGRAGARAGGPRPRERGGVTGAAAPLVLVVEDSDAIRAAFTILLEESGYAVAAAATGAEALRLAERRAPDLVLLDLGLPDMPGLDVARRIKAATARVPIVALT